MSRRPKHNTSHASRNNTLVALTTDERTISQRKMAIAMYGYSWLKPAGCAKTMLGRREEEVEREEVERQLREVELQERLAQEAEEQDRLARLNGMGEPEEGRDLDEDIPDADEEEDEDLSEDEDEAVEAEEGEDEEGMQGDLDDEIPDADDQDDDEDDEPLSPAAYDGGWVYDTRREPDTDDEDQLPPTLQPPRTGGLDATRGHGRHATIAGVRVSMPGSEYDYDERDAEDLADAMLDEDEMFDDSIHGSGPGHPSEERDLDDDVPDPENDQAWEHTDTELEESEMDISILPGQALQTGRISSNEISQAQQPRRISGRAAATAPRSSGPWIAGPSPLPSPRLAQGHVLPRHRATPNATTTTYPTSTTTPRSASTRAARIVSGNRQRPYRPEPSRQPPRRRFQDAQTPDMFDTPPHATDAEVEEEEDLEEADTDIEADAETPDPFVAPEHVRAIARPTQAATGGGPQIRGRAHIGARGVMPNPAMGAAALPAPQAEGRRANHLNTSPSRTAAARTWLDGAAAAMGVGSGSGSGSSARRTLFQRATRRRGNMEPEAATAAAAAGFPSDSGAGASSGGIFSSPNSGGAAEATNATGGGSGGGAAAAGDWDTPPPPTSSADAVDTGEDVGGNAGSQEPVRRVTRRRSGRFLGSRRRGVE